MGYFHVLLIHEGEEETVALLDLSQAELKAQFLKPYSKGEALLIGSRVMTSDKVRGVRILISSEHSKVLLAREQQRRIDADADYNRRGTGLMFHQSHTLGPADLADLSADVTAKFLNRLPGSKPGPVVGVLNHGWTLAVVAAVIAGLLVAFLAKKLGLT